MKNLLFVFAFIISTTSLSQKLVSAHEKIESAQNDLKNELTQFSLCLVNSHLPSCTEQLLKSGSDNYRKYVIANTLYFVDPALSFRLHEEAYTADKNNAEFALKYAIELHRRERYKEAVALYEDYALSNTDDFRIFVWLSECYLNLGDINKSIENWNKADHARNHTGIDFAIFSVHGETDQLKKRSDYKKLIAEGDVSKFYPLIFLDQNWQSDWWNKGEQTSFLEEDLALARRALGPDNKDYQTLAGYAQIKDLENSFSGKDSIRQILLDLKLVLDNNPLPANGGIASDLLGICFGSALLEVDKFYSARGAEILNIAKKTKDKDMLNIYAFLQATVEGKVKPEIDKLGWKEFKDERFAISYFIGKREQNRFDDADLGEALQDFPNSAKLFWFKAKCAREEKRDPNTHLIELIKREFKSLASDQSRYSYLLRNYFTFLKI